MEAEGRIEGVPVLIVEDDEIQRLLTSRALAKDLSLNVLATNSGIAALEVARSTSPAVVVSNFSMAGMNGVDLCRAFKNDPFLRESIFILIMPNDGVEDRVRGLESGADDYVTKPVHPNELLARVQGGLRVKNMQDKLKEDKKALAVLNESLHESYAGILQLLVRLIDMRIPNATARAERAEKIARWIGAHLEIDAVALDDLATAARLHEIGKIGFPDGLLKKGLENLTEEERNEIGTFPTFGERIVDGIHRLKSIGRFLRHQLENYDGTGYPDRLMHQQIPLGARILRAVNLIEQLGPRKGKAQGDTVMMIHRSRGTILDPIVVQLADEYLTVIENPSWLKGKLQLDILDLQAGMVLAHDLTTGSGTKLLPKDSLITTHHIEKILTHHHFDPVINGVYIYDAQSSDVPNVTAFP